MRTHRAGSVHLVLLLLSLAVTSTTWAQDRARALVAGQRYDGGELVHDPARGLSFRLPQRWAGRMPLDSQALLLNAPLEEGIGIVVFLDRMTPEALLERLSEPQDFGGSVILQLSRSIEHHGRQWKAAYLSGNVIGRALGILGPEEQAVIYFFAGPGNEAETYEQVLADLGSSTRFEATSRP